MVEAPNAARSHRICSGENGGSLGFGTDIITNSCEIGEPPVGNYILQVRNAVNEAMDECM